MKWTSSITRQARHSTCLWLIVMAMFVPGLAAADPLPSKIPAAGSSSASVVPSLGTSALGGIVVQGFLPVDQAFAFTPLQSGEELLLRWQMPPGYYLYRDRLTVKAGPKLVPVELPEGLAIVDEYFGEVQVFYDGLDASVTLPAGLENVTVEYQGCADAGLCYPPERRSIALQP